MLMRKLQAGESVAYKSGGNSLAPHVQSGDLCVYTPVREDADVNVGDIVFCTVNELYGGQQFYAHAVLSKK